MEPPTASETDEDEIIQYTGNKISMYHNSGYNSVYSTLYVRIQDVKVTATPKRIRMDVALPPNFPELDMQTILLQHLNKLTQRLEIGLILDRTAISIPPTILLPSEYPLCHRPNDVLRNSTIVFTENTFCNSNDTFFSALIAARILVR